MTEELSPEFETFSQMLDDEEAFERELTDDERVLVDLGTVLREDSRSAPLSDSFARETTSHILQRYETLSTPAKLYDKSRFHLTQSILGPSGLAKGLGLAAVGLGLAAASFKALAIFGSALILFSMAWLRQERRLGSPALGRGTLSSPSRTAATFLFYVLPLGAVLFTAVLAGGLIAGLKLVSITFRNDDSLTLLPTLVGIGVAVLLTKACSGFWKACLARAGSQPLKVAAFQAVHGVWIGLILGLLASIGNLFTVERSALALDGSIGLLGMVLFILVVVVANYKYSDPPETLPSLAQAGRTFAMSLLLGFTPIVLVLFGFYQFHLTREITNSSQKHVLKVVDAWLADQRAIPDSKNGWVDLKPFLLRDELNKPENALVSEQLTGLSEFHRKEHNSYKDLTGQTLSAYQEKKGDFLKALPHIASALDKPYYSPTATQGFGIESLTPNFTTYRGVSQGLSLLTQEALAQGNPDEALAHIELSLRWARADEPSSLITLMIQVAQLDITHQGLEEAVITGQFNESQLAVLSVLLENHRPQPNLLAMAMERETVLIDRFMRQLVNGTADAEEAGLPTLVRLLPSSYWESERKAYWNFQLDQISDCLTLSNPAFDAHREVNPMNLTTTLLAPTAGRAIVQFCYIHSKYTSAILMCELELYKLEHGDYPSDLSVFGRRAVDAMDPLPWANKRPFGYLLTDNGYKLISESAWYERIGLANRQVYGHHKPKR